MSISKISAFTVGLILIGWGCFLPWQVEGDFVSYSTAGIRVLPSFADHGGTLILLLGIALALLVFKPPRYIEKPDRGILALSAALTLVSTYHVLRWIIDLSGKRGWVGAPMIQTGLVMVFLGSIILLIASLLHYRKLSR
jgi:Kef-type K+ transport system membrane component KefB